MSVSIVFERGASCVALTGGPAIGSWAMTHNNERSSAIFFKELRFEGNEVFLCRDVGWPFCVLFRRSKLSDGNVK